MNHATLDIIAPARKIKRATLNFNNDVIISSGTTNPFKRPACIGAINLARSQVTELVAECYYQEYGLRCSSL